MTAISQQFHRNFGLLICECRAARFSKHVLTQGGVVLVHEALRDVVGVESAGVEQDLVRRDAICDIEYYRMIDGSEVLLSGDVVHQVVKVRKQLRFMEVVVQSILSD